MAPALVPFSSLTDPIDLARAQSALDAAWQTIKPLIDEADWQHERTRLASVVAAYAAISIDEEDLCERALRRYRET